MRGVWTIAALMVGLMTAGAAAAQGRMSPQEAMQLAGAAGFTMRGNQAYNACGRPTQPRFAFADLNGDGRPEAIAAEVDAACYGAGGESFAVLWRDPAGTWIKVGAGRGRIMLLQSRTAGWRDYTLEGPGCQRVWSYDAAQRGYFSPKPCPGESGYRRANAATAPPPKPAVSVPADRAAAFRAAGVTPVGGRYLACDKSQEMQIEIRDLNGDGRPDAVITDGGTECYGMTGQGFTLVTNDANGAWRRLYQSQGIPTFQASRGVGGWPDIENGGPGFCHPVMRWNGRDYVTVRWNAEQPGACAGRR